MSKEFLDPQKPYWTGKIGDAQWDRLKAKLLGGTDAGGTSYSKIVSVTESEADTIIENMKKDPKGYPQMHTPGGAEQYKMMEGYFNFLVDEYLEKPFRKQVNAKIEEEERKTKLKELLAKKANTDVFKKALTPTVSKVEPPQVTPVQDKVEPPKPVEPPAPPTPVAPAPVAPPAQTSKVEEKKPRPVKHQKLESGMITVLKRVEKSLKETVNVIGKSNDDVQIRLENQGNLMMSGFTKVTNVINSTARALREQTDSIEKIAQEKTENLERELDRASAAREQALQEKLDGGAGNSRIERLKKVVGKKLFSGGAGSKLKDFLGPASRLGSARGIRRLLRRVRNPRRTMTAMRRLARMRLKRVPFVGNALAKQGSKLVNFGAKAFRPIASPVGKKIAAKIGGKTIAKAVGKGVGKSLIKKVPLLGAVAGVAFGIERAMKGDWLGAIGEVASGVASTVPGVGTAVSTGIDAALVAKDIAGAETGGEIPGISSLPGATSKGEYDRARRDAGIKDLSVASFMEEENAKLDWQKKNAGKIASILSDGYQRYFPPALRNLATQVWDTIKGFFTGMIDWVKSNLMGREGDGYLGPQWLGIRNPFAGDMPEATGEYDIIIPLDHMKSGERIPDYEGGNTYENSAATGAAGREREHQDLAAAKLKAKLEAGGLKVRIVAPEEFTSYEKYDEYIRGEASHGTRILPLHFDAGRDASGKLVGTGFLTRTREGDAEDAAFAAPIQRVLEDFQRENTNLGNIKVGGDTVGNATVNQAAASPAALIELGIMTWWEKEVGKDFTESAKFDKLITGVSSAILETTPPRNTTPTPPPTPTPTPIETPVSSLLQNSGQYALSDYVSPGLTLSAPSLNLLQSNQSTVIPAFSEPIVPGGTVSFLDILESGQLSRLK